MLGSRTVRCQSHVETDRKKRSSGKAFSVSSVPSSVVTVTRAQGREEWRGRSVRGQPLRVCVNLII